ncbi:acetyl esterase/lipase [Glaciihabitans tibetensis]|uniref:Acetyl esterase/lipase n=1 Tax=Glaciihabitans tibetensis TaxID=1266600 RepID=A0A2T0VBL0_9MICO|nr:alpha/beta hydrolase [Glaciihabitans tibetensis]PRY67513.1 acetyl esterase/lipase [Glaciihabitans tibetensis]
MTDPALPAFTTATTATTSTTASTLSAATEAPRAPGAPVPTLADADLQFRAAVDADPQSPPPLMLVLPGGSYREHADHEGITIADWLAEIGVNALVVKYPVDPARYPAALRRVQDVLAAARSGALDFGTDETGAAVVVDRSRIGVLGFSAGGHVAALMATGVTSAPVDPANRVDLSVLCYPVISMTHEPHGESLESLLGNDDTLDDRRALSAEHLVSAQTPPTFLWHTADDGAVAVSHSLRYASALAAHNVPFDLHVFERGDHGKGLAYDLGPLEAWSALCESWLGEHGWVGGPASA